MTAPALWDHLAFQARLRPHGLAVVAPAGPVAWRDLARDVACVATHLLEADLGPDDMVGLTSGFGYADLLLVLALDRLGVPSTPVAAPLDAARLAARHVTAVAAAEPAPPGVPVPWIVLPDLARLRQDGADAARLAARDAPPDGLLRVMWSSGTTGGAKGSPIDRRIQRERLEARRLLHGLGPRARCFTAMPLSAPSGYIDPLATLAAGGTVVLPGPAAGFPLLAETLGVTHASATPLLWQRLLDGLDPASPPLASLACLEVSGAALPEALATALRRRVTPHVWVAYGTSETQRVAMAEAAACAGDPDCVGAIMPGVEVGVVDAGGRPLPPGTEGQLRIRGPQVIAGYFRDPAATARNFRDGWFHPGDLGTVGPDGRLRITGRVEDTILQDGVALSPAPIETAMRAIDGVRDVAVFAVPLPQGGEALAAGLVLAPGTDPETVRQAAAASLGARAPTLLVTLDALPRTPTGKVMRREIAARVLDRLRA